MKSLTQSMVDIQKVKDENEKTLLVCHIWKNEVKSLNVKLIKTLEHKATFTIDTSKYKLPSHNPYRTYKFEEN